MSKFKLFQIILWNTKVSMDLFNALIVKNRIIIRDEKLFYYKYYLVAEPLKLINKQQFTDHNFQIPYELLDGRFNIKRQILTIMTNVINLI